MSAAVLDRPNAYQPIGAARALWACRDDEAVIDGPAGTGKSRACLEKLYLAAMKYAGMRALICRKTRESLTESALVTFESHVVPKGTPWIANQQRRVRQSYELPNGSEIVVGGLDKSSKIMSTEYDMIYVQEAREATEADWEDLTTRLRNGVMPYQQIIGDTNPDAPGHWIKRRANRGALRLIPSRHSDNPTVTPQYLARLDALTGVRKLRLRDGLWVAAEGAVYKGWDPAVHLVDTFPIPETWPRFRTIDFGFTNPFVCQWWAEDPDGRLYRYRELYGTQRLVEDWAHEIHDHSLGEWITATACDHDAEGRATLERHLSHGERDCNVEHRGQTPTSAARKAVEDGIDAVAARLKVAGDGKPRLFLIRDARVNADPLLVEALKPTCTEEEIESYVWDEIKGGRLGERILEEPRKIDDHGCDGMRYAVMYADDPVRAYAAVMGKVQPMPSGSRARPDEPSIWGAPRDEMARDRQRQMGGRRVTR